MMTKKRKKNKEAEPDRISSLPDGILIQILCDLPYKQVARAALLSKRWYHVWLSYPVLEFNDEDYDHGELSRSTKSFIAAASRNLSSVVNEIKAVRIDSSDSALIEAAMDLIRNREPQVIDMTITSTVSLSIQLPNTTRRLRTLKLYGCQLMINHDADHYEMINLRELRLSRVGGIDNRALNSMIAAAPLLEKLTLNLLDSVTKVDLCNNANLKHLQISHMSNVDEIVVGGALLPSLESLDIELCTKLSGHVVNKLVSESTSLLSLRFCSVIKVEGLKIESPTLERLELKWCVWHSKRVLRIDAPRLVHVFLGGGQISFLQAITQIANLVQPAEIRSTACTLELSLSCTLIESQIFDKLKSSLRKVTPQFQFVKLRLDHMSSVSKSEGFVDCYTVEDDSPTPVVERVQVETLIWGSLNQNSLYHILWSCNPKYFSVSGGALRLSSLELLNNVFMERTRTSDNCKKGAACNCWRHRLKDVKIVNLINEEKEELVDISNHSLTTLGCGNQIVFRLIWD